MQIVMEDVCLVCHDTYAFFNREADLLIIKTHPMHLQRLRGDYGSGLHAHTSDKRILTKYDAICCNRLHRESRNHQPEGNLSAEGWVPPRMLNNHCAAITINMAIIFHRIGYSRCQNVSRYNRNILFYMNPIFDV
jgi:hypothetical protein